MLGLKIFFSYIGLFVIFSIADINGVQVVTYSGHNATSDCHGVECSYLKCKPGYMLKKIDIFCCPICLCEPCEEVALDRICPDKWTAVVNPKLNNECCETYSCISNNRNEDIILEIDNMHEGSDPSEYKEYLSRNSYRCSSINCTDEKYQYALKNSACPADSFEVRSNDLEADCCETSKVCVCDRCKSEKEVDAWCGRAGNGFKATLVEKGDGTPGKCCDIHICHTTNFTCQLGGEFYPHEFEWMSDQCTKCKCDFGHVKCGQVECSHASCEVKKILADQCCAVCTGECFDERQFKYYKPNETWFHNNDACIECKCINGKKSCLTESCAPSQCVHPVKTPEVCCPTCAKVNSTCEQKCHDLKCQYEHVLDQYGCSTCKCANKSFIDISTKLINNNGNIKSWIHSRGFLYILLLVILSLILLAFLTVFAIRENKKHLEQKKIDTKFCLVDKIKRCCWWGTDKSYDVQMTKDAEINSKLRSIYNGKSTLAHGSYKAKIERKAKRESSPFLAKDSQATNKLAVHSPETSILLVRESSSNSTTIPSSIKQIYYL